MWVNESAVCAVCVCVCAVCERFGIYFMSDAVFCVCFVQFCVCVVCVRSVLGFVRFVGIFVINRLMLPLVHDCRPVIWKKPLECVFLRSSRQFRPDKVISLIFFFLFFFLAQACRTLFAYIILGTKLHRSTIFANQCPTLAAFCVLSSSF